MSLTSGQRKMLRSLAHHLEPVVLVGKQGVTDTLVRSASEALEAHELVKVRFNEFKDEKQALAEEIARRTGAEVVGIVGHVATLYKRQQDPDKRLIDLPKQ
jgi:RNA-binding protein